MLTLAQGLLVDLITDAIAVGGALEAPFVGLFTATTAPITADITLADITEANYTGYLRSAIGTWSTAFVDSDGRVSAQADALEFRPTGTAITNVVVGYFYASLVAAGVLLGIELLPAPVSMDSPLSMLTIVPKLGLLKTWNYGEASVIN